jgi:hypothetical protein
MVAARNVSEAPRLEPAKVHPSKLRAPPRAAVAAGLFIGAAVLLGASVILFSPGVSLPASPCAAFVAAFACRIAASDPVKSLPREPWGFDAYGLLVVGFSIFALGWAVGPEIEPIVWLLVVLLFVLGIHAFNGLADKSPSETPSKPS